MDFSKLVSNMTKVNCRGVLELLCLLIYVSHSDAVQRFVELPTYTEVNPGEDALLICRVSDKKGVCSWQKDNKPVGIYKGKYEWANEDSPVGGDCSLWVRAATLQLDDGQWQCQVTASNYDVQDALSSPPAALAVRVPPQAPRILFNGSHVTPGTNITVAAGARATVVCEARYGNPPAYIEWYLDQERLTAWSQTNASEAERPRVWAARSVLELGARRSARGRQLTCRAHHPSYPPPRHRDSYTLLDVTYAPTVSITGADPSQLNSLEEGSSALSLECRGEGNPAPYVWWTKDGQVIAANGPKLILAPVTRNHSGIYGCQGRNMLGTSDSAKIEIDVKYAPRVTWAGPAAVVEADLFSKVALECRADGNPPPEYQWYHSPGADYSSALAAEYPVSASPLLELHNVTYAQQGRYTCVALNRIGLEERRSEGESLRLHVAGPPVGAAAGAAHAWSGGEARVSATVCADPKPRAVWLWGSLRLEVPSVQGRYRALAPSAVGGCYRYTLLLAAAAAPDARVYVLRAENERGASSHAVSLTVHETAHVAPLIAAALVIAALLVVVFCLIIRCRRRRENVQYKTDEMDSEKQVLPADAVYGPRTSIAQPAPSPAAAAARPQYSPAALQSALTSLENEAKDNVYAVLDPHIQYEITISKHGEPPKYLSLSKPLTHQRTHAFHTHDAAADELNNNTKDPNVSSFKPKSNIRKSNRSTDDRNVCRTNNDIEYIRDPNFDDFNRRHDADRDNVRGSKSYTRMYDRNSSRRGDKARNTNEFASVRRSSGSRKGFREDAQDCSYNNDRITANEEYRPKPGKVREIASKFNQYSGSIRNSLRRSKRPKPLQTFANQAYLDHVFPDAVEI